MRVITVSQDCVIDDVFYRKGEVVRVADNFIDTTIAGKTLLSKPDKQMKAENEAKVKVIKDEIKAQKDKAEKDKKVKDAPAK